MTIQTYLIVDKSSGIPVYIRNFDENQEESTRDVLFSGMMSAIGTLMEEMELGNFRNISTEKYNIFGKEGSRYSHFIIGQLEFSNFIDMGLDGMIKYLDYIPLDDSNLQYLTEDIIEYLDSQTDILNNIYLRSNYISAAYEYSETSGSKSLIANSPEAVENYLANYFSNLTYKNFTKDHVFLDILFDDSYILGCSFYNTDDKKSFTRLPQAFAIAVKFTNPFSSSIHRVLNGLLTL